MNIHKGKNGDPGGKVNLSPHVTDTAVPVGTAGEAPAVPETKATGKTKTASARLTGFFFGLLYALWGYLLGGCVLPFGATPFGFALLCASTRRVPYVYVGLCLSALTLSHPAVRIAAYSVALLVRILVRFTIDTPWRQDKPATETATGEGAEAASEHRLADVFPLLFSEHIRLRVASSCVAVFTVALYFLVEGGFLYYDLYGALLALTVAPAATLLFSGYFREAEDGWVRSAGFLAIACALSYAARALSIRGISVAAFGIMMATLIVTRKRGLLAGALTGTLCGLCWSPLLAPVFAFGALCGALLFPVSVTVGSLAVFAVGVWWGMYAKGISVLTGLTPALLAASLLFAVVDKLFLTEKSVAASADEAEAAVTAEAEETGETVACRVMEEEMLDSVRLADSNYRMKKLCESFSELSEVFEGMSRAVGKPQAEDLRQICDSAFDSSCAGCPDRSACWDENYRETTAQIGTLSAVLHREGKVDRTSVGAALSARCGRLPDILDEINHNAAVRARQILRGDKTEIFASEYASVAELLAENMVEDADEYISDGDLAQKLADALSAVCPAVSGVAVYGDRQKRIFVRGTSMAELAGNREAIGEILASCCPFGLQCREVRELPEGGGELCFARSAELSVSYARRTVRAQGEEEYCGDTIGIFRRADSRFFAFISDGMGSGREAAVTSGVCALFLQKMLSAGNHAGTTLRMLNGFLRNKGSGSIHECSATVDLMELDLIGRRASFYKSGAAPTYVLRDGALFKLRSKTVPVGILKEPDTKKISFDVSAGDVIVMVSDGVTQGREECPWLFDLLRGNVDSLGVERTADLVMKYAKGEGCTDDLSVVIVKIGEEAEKKE